MEEKVTVIILSEICHFPVSENEVFLSRYSMFSIKAASVLKETVVFIPGQSAQGVVPENVPEKPDEFNPRSI